MTHLRSVSILKAPRGVPFMEGLEWVALSMAVSAEIALLGKYAAGSLREVS